MELLSSSLPRTKNDEFIWLCSSGDISFAEKEWIDKILKRIKKLPKRTFFFQSKDPICFNNYEFPQNVILGTTIETNRDEGYNLISKAPLPSKRKADYQKVNHPKKVVTIEPIMDFDLEILVKWMREISPERVYVGYDTKNSSLIEPELWKTCELCKQLTELTKVKIKTIPTLH